MGQWYRDNQRLFREEKEALASKHPSLKLEVVDARHRINDYVCLQKAAAVVHGIYGLNVPGTARTYDYRIALVLADSYFKRPPLMYCDDLKLPVGNIDRHIMSDGRACLGVNTDLAQRWHSRPSIVTFLDEVVAPFLAWQVYYDAHGCPPPWGQRSHHKEGILQFYAELLNIPVDPQVEGFMKLLARKNAPKGHEPCPCGSSPRLRNCHADAVKNVRQKVFWQDVAFDLALLQNPDTQK